MNDVPLLDLVVDQAFASDDRLMLLSTSPSPDLSRKFGPERVRTFPISEAAMVGIAVGVAMMGRRAVVDLNRSSFLYVAMDQLVNHAACVPTMSGGRYTVPIVVTSATRGPWQLGPQHEVSPYGLFMQTPGLVVIVPGSLSDAVGLLRTALMHDGPSLYFVSPTLAGERGLNQAFRTPPIPLGCARTLRSGSDATIVAIGPVVPAALSAADILERHGIEADVISPRTLVPLDVEAIVESVDRTGSLVLVDEGPASGAPASIAAALLASEELSHLAACDMRVVAPPTRHVPPSPPLEAAMSVTANDVVAAVTDIKHAGRGL